MLYLFDLDGTIISSYMDTPGRRYDAWELLPGRRETIAALLAEGHRVALVTNQGGVGAGFASLDEARAKLKTVASALGFPLVRLNEFAGAQNERGLNYSTEHFGAPTALGPGQLTVFVCYAGPNSDGPMGGNERARRKPSGRMIEEAQSVLGLGMTVGEADELIDVPTLYVGDRSEDQAAATDAGVAFAWAHEFFRS